MYSPHFEALLSLFFLFISHDMFRPKWLCFRLTSNIKCLRNFVYVILDTPVVVPLYLHCLTAGYINVLFTRYIYIYISSYYALPLIVMLPAYCEIYIYIYEVERQPQRENSIYDPTSQTLRNEIPKITFLNFATSKFISTICNQSFKIMSHCLKSHVKSILDYYYYYYYYYYY
jgi:hypothetical protein